MLSRTVTAGSSLSGLVVVEKITVRVTAP